MLAVAIGVASLGGYVLVLWGLARLLMNRPLGVVAYPFVTAYAGVVAGAAPLAFVDNPSEALIFALAACMGVIWIGATVVFAVRSGRAAAKR